MRILLSVAMAAAWLSAVPAQASSFNARGGARVNPVNAAVFEVIPRGRNVGQAFWCAAADYARRVLNAPWTAQVYVARGLGTSVTTGRKSAVQFTLDPKAAGITPVPPSLSLNSMRVGESMSVQQATGYCNVSPTRF
jgi:hypothetical protein